MIAHWQLLELGLTLRQAYWWSRDLRKLFDGVYVTGHGPVTRRQRWWAATLTTPHSTLSHASAAAAHEARFDPRGFVTIVRPGSSGLVRAPGLLISHAKGVLDFVTEVDGVRVTTPERTVIDLWPHLRPPQAEKLVREMLRRRKTTSERLLQAIAHHRGRRGVASLRRYVARIAHLPIHRCRSDAEAFALVVLDDAGYATPEVNAYHAGYEADLCWTDLRHILEIDGPQFHRFKDEDARKTRAWTAAGYLVRRVSSDDVFADPSSVIAAAPPAAKVRPRRRGTLHTRQRASDYTRL